MSAGKSSFQDEYKIVQVIKTRKDKKTSIIQNTIGQYYILKKFYMTDTYALNEIGLMKTIHHPNIVSCHDIIMEKGRIYLIEEYCQEGDLAYFIKNQVRKRRSYFGEKMVSKWLLQILLAIQYLHNKKIMHRDIRPENIYLTSIGNVKLGSFRSSKMFCNQFDLAATVIGSPYYMAPQCLEGRGYDQKVDIWAFGILLYEICTLKFMFSNKNIVEQAQIILQGANRQLPSIYSKQLVEIYTKCLTKNPNERPSAKALIRQNYFLQKMKKFVTEKPESLRIPIKHYNVHFNVLAKKKKENDVNQLKKTLRLKKLNQGRIHTPMLPKIEEGTKVEEKRKSSRSYEKAKVKQQPKSVQITKQKSIDRVRQAIRQKSRQIIRQNVKEREKSKQLVRKLSSNKIDKFVVNSPNEGKKSKDPNYSEKKVSVEKARKIEKLKSQDSIQSPKSLLLPPPMLPRPPQRKLQKKQAQKISQSNQMNFSETKRKQDLAAQLSTFRQQSQQKFNKQQIKSSLTKIFDDLNIKQDEQQQFSFQIQDENLARLTIKPNQGNFLIQTYKSKLQQLVQEINYKYCPIMEPIQERTQEFDSNTFANVRRQ